jgi:glycosyltransferase involved in cell wall biosynthesis
VRIVLASANFRPHTGGIERFAELLAGGLAARGHDVTVLGCRSQDAPLRERLDGYEIVRVPSTYLLERRAGVPYPIPSPELAGTVGDALANADAVHVNDALYATSIAALRAARRRGVPSVLTQHVAFVPQRNALLDAAQRIAIATLGRAARLATVVVTYNPDVSEWAARTWHIPEPKVMPVGVPPPARGIDRGAVRRSFGVPEDAFVALFVGRDVPKKGLDVVLAAADPAYRLVAVTDRTRDAPGATLLPFMSPDRLAELMAAADAFVLPSEGEGFPLTLQEAFAAGLPVVTTMQPGYEHFVGAGDVLAVERAPGPVRDALRRLAADPGLAVTLAARSREVADRHFGLDRFVSAYEELYGSITTSS